MGINSLVLVLVAFSSLLSMFALTSVDSIIRQELYSHGLEFSYEWAMPYWTMATLVFALGWFNIIIAIAFQFYVLRYGRERAEVMPQREATEPETTSQQPIEEKPIEAEQEPQEMKPAETAEAETKETIAPPMEVELETRKEGEEAQKPVEEPKEELVTIVEEEREEAELREPLTPPVEAGGETLAKGEEALQLPEGGEGAAAAAVGTEVGIAMETTMAQTMQPQARTAPQQLIVCQSCGTQNPIGTDFCENCGASLVPVTQVKCPKCGAEVPSTMKFCGNCGSLLKPEEIATAIEEAPPEERIETKLPEEVQEVEGQRKQEAEPKETVEPKPKPEEKSEEPQEPVDVELQEEMPRETVETETQETPPPAPEIEAETTEREETQTQT